MAIAYPDYKNCGLNVIASIKKYFNTPCHHQTHKELDALLQAGQYRNVVLMLFDGMSMSVLKNHLKEEGFFRTHVYKTLSAVYPSTTTAATTSIECEVSPKEHGWLGWSIYFDEIDKTVDIFINREQHTGKEIKEYNVVSKFMPRTFVFDEMNEHGVKACPVSSFTPPYYKTKEEMMCAIQTLTHEEGTHYIYSYYGDPDHQMHEKGVTDISVTKILQDIEKMVQDLSEKVSDDTLILVTADHGLIDANYVYIEDHEELKNMLIRPFSVEQRAAAFHVKEAYKEAFVPAFKKAFGEHFLIMTGAEFINSGFLGEGTANKKLPSIVGDFVALATDETTLCYDRQNVQLKGVHAGLMEEEMRVPLIVIKK